MTSGGATPVVSVPKPDSGAPAAPNAPAAAAEARPKIQTFAQGLAGGHHQEAWKRPTNLTGTGATHVRSFHCKLTGDSLENLDRQINEWLDSHPDYEVKLVTTTVGEWTGKLKEPNLIIQVWV